MIIGTANPQVVSARGLFGKTSGWVYNLLRHVEPGLMLDVGAARGEMTKKMRSSSPKSTVIAYEPFPGNWPLFEKLVGHDERVVLRPVAVGDKAGTMPFYVASETGSESGWGAGYSSVGSLVRPEDGKKGKTIDVSVIRLDEEIIAPVRFAKLDVQGAELQAILGMGKLSVDLLCVEYDTIDASAIEHMFSLGWSCLDSGYTIISSNNVPADPDEWETSYEAVNSTGLPLVGGWPRNAPREPKHYIEWMKAQAAIYGNVFTDLIFVAPHYQAKFLRAAGDMSEFLERYFEKRATAGVT